VTEADAEAAAAHVALVRASLSRIAARGADVEGAPSEATVRTYLESGHAALFQAAVGEEVRSSDLVVQVGDATHYLSGGTSPEGNKLGTGFGARPVPVVRVEGLTGTGLVGAMSRLAGRLRR
jgi:hypothetical protein